MSEKFIIYTDGGARGNPGPSASAFVVIAGNKIFYKESEFLGIGTNNQAEYHAVLIALKWLSKNTQNLHQDYFNFYSDSELVTKQLKGLYKIKNINLKVYATEIKKIEKSLKFKINYNLIVREKNKLADKLVNETLDKEVIK